MQSVSIKYSLKWRFKNQPQYAVTECKKVVNMRNNRLLKQVLNGGSIGLLDRRKICCNFKNKWNGRID